MNWYEHIPSKAIRNTIRHNANNRTEEYDEKQSCFTTHKSSGGELGRIVLKTWYISIIDISFDSATIENISLVNARID